MKNGITSEKKPLLAQLSSIITTILAIVGTIVGIWEFNYQQRVTQTQIFKQKIWELRQSVYTNIAKATGEIIVFRNDKKALDSIKIKYQNLYYSFMPMCEDATVEDSLIAFNVQFEIYLKQMDAKKQMADSLLKKPNANIERLLQNISEKQGDLLKHAQIGFVKSLGVSMKHVEDVLIEPKN